MKKFCLFSMFFAIILSICCGFYVNTIDLVLAETEISSKSACLMDFDSKQVLFEKNSHEHLPVASMVKMMTILLTLKNLEEGNISLDEKVMTSENASGMGGSQVFIDPYEEYVLSDMLKSVIIASANDASVALAEHISGSESNFVKQMNKCAKELNMLDTNYVNCTGLPAPEQYSSAYDSAIVLSEITKYDTYHEFSTIWMDKLVHPSGRVTELVNTNRLVKYYDGCDGGKTGSTNEAGCCLSASAKRDNMRLISVIVGAPDSKSRFNECSSLFNYGFANFENKNLVSTENSVGNIQVLKGKIDNIDVYAKEDFSAVVNKNEKSEFEVSVKLPTSVKGGIKAGESIGKILVLKNSEVVKEIEIVTHEDLEKMGYIDSVKKVLNKW